MIQGIDVANQGALISAESVLREGSVASGQGGVLVAQEAQTAAIAVLSYLLLQSAEQSGLRLPATQLQQVAQEETALAKSAPIGLMPNGQTPSEYFASQAFAAGYTNQWLEGAELDRIAGIPIPVPGVPQEALSLQSASALYATLMSWYAGMLATHSVSLSGVPGLSVGELPAIVPMASPL
ncbi:MAG: hypothetical protein ACYDAQ_01860 [Mycobacteriales bacterium]